MYAMTTTTASLAIDYAKAINWSRWFTLVKTLGDHCNGRKDRFDKADILENGIAVYSGGRLEWVDGIGRDHHDTLLNLDIEFKFAKNSMFSKTKKNGFVPKKVISMKIKNSLGDTTTAEIQDPAAFYMFAQEEAVGLISYEEMKPYLKVVGDGISTEIPHEKMTFIQVPSDSESQEESLVTACDYLQRKRAMQLAFIDSI